MKKLLFAAAFALGAVATGLTYTQFTPAQKLRFAEEAISKFYVDTVNEDKLVEDAINGMLEKLDPHSSYTNAEETRELNEPLQGSFSGIGITYNMDRDTLYIISTVSGGPSEKVGIMAGDRIIAVNDTSIAGQQLKNSQVQKKLRGPKGTKVNLRVLRKERAEVDTIDFVVTRAEIPIYSVDAAYIVAPGVGYLRLNKFGADTPKEVTEALQKLRKEGMEDLILDLTDNGGGYLNASVDLLSELLEPGSLAVYTEGNASPRYDFRAFPSRFEPLFADGRLVVMVNQNTASASEITSGAVQDWDRGVIVGRRTFGKGLVQRPIPFPDGSMIRLTTAHYYTPTGRDIQKPYRKGEGDKYREDLNDRLISGELMHEDSIKHIDSLRVNTLRLSRPIYGGGGIHPDKFVAMDTSQYTKYYRNVMAKGLFNRFAISYVEEHRKELKKLYPTDDEYVARFEISDSMLGELRRMADEEKIEFNQEEYEKSLPLLKMILKALIGRDIYESATYFKVYNQYDPIFREALGIITSDEYDRILAP